MSTPLLKVTSKSQFFNRPISGLKACTPTALYFAYRFLDLAESGQLQMNKTFLKKELCDGVTHGGTLNKMLPKTYGVKSAREVLQYVAQQTQQFLPGLMEVANKFGILDPTQLPDDSNFMPDVMTSIFDDPDAPKNIAVIVTSANHSTVILRINNHYFFIDSADNFFCSTLEIYNNREHLLNRLLKTWGPKAIQVDLTQVAIAPKNIHDDEHSFDAPGM